MQPVMERSHPTSGRPATPADINRNGRPTSIGTSGRHQSECPADIIGMRNLTGLIREQATPFLSIVIGMRVTGADPEGLPVEVTLDETALSTIVRAVRESKIEKIRDILS